MRALILAAGRGLRLHPHTLDIPKCLLKVGGKELLEYQLDALYSYNIKGVALVTGHHADKVKGKAGNRAKCIFNPLYDKGGILFSFQAAKDYVYGKEFIYMAGDIIFHPKILELILNQKGDIVLGVEKKECDEEDSKALISEGEIIKMGKKIKPVSNKELMTEFVHIAKFSEKGSQLFFDSISDVFKEHGKYAFMMDALNAVIKRGIKLIPVYVSDLPRIEIDFIGDLEKARNMIFH